MGFINRVKGKSAYAALQLGSLGKRLDQVPSNATFTPAAGSANVCLVTIQFQDANGNNLVSPTNIDIWLSDAATGLALTVTTASGAVAAGASGTDLAAVVSKKYLRSQTTAAGVYILSITDTGKTGFYVAASVHGGIVVSAQLITGNYG